MSVEMRIETAARQKVPAAKDLKLHHVGFVVSSISAAAEAFAQSVGATWDGNIVFDSVQKVSVTFFQGQNAADTLIELVEPAEPSSPVTRFMESGGGLHHLCYEVDDLEGHLDYCKTVGNVVIRRPVPAVAFGGRRIAWALSTKKLLLEFLERERSSR